MSSSDPRAPHRPTPPGSPALGPRGIVLLAAGRGERMRPLTEHHPKALLALPDEPDRTVLDAQLQAVLARSDAEVVVVTGFAAPQVDAHLRTRYAAWGDRIRTAHNPEWAEDVNIGSVARGVAALRAPREGYLIIETDLLLDGTAWDALFAGLRRSRDSHWICRGVYGPQRTGGVVHAGADGWIDVVDYRPRHDPACDGWPKMLGMLAVGPREVEADIALRAAAMRRGLRQYYLSPWTDGLDRLRARVLPLDAGFAATFNTPAEFDAAVDAWRAAVASPA